ncbi:hypothetical protein FD06_GL000823 [Apilactobacillus ozensis DSM 23829 = JCM 17196]|uniref:Uncharacterized protein n=2 Tax=Apilactobacillus ozensis TaxID=866801 RepID=A0A0R2AZA1_9LACO|nr:hypothetical protein FD06_GL000823 [Apilactobacillus ozensis DSM 23829 = JCM 17196]
MNKNYKEVLDAFTIIMGIKTDENGQKKLGFRNTEEIDEIFHQNVTDEDKERYLQKIVNHIQKIQNK